MKITHGLDEKETEPVREQLRKQPQTGCLRSCPKSAACTPHNIGQQAELVTAKRRYTV